MSHWINELKSDIEKEFAEKPAIATLATVQLSERGAFADARCIVVRRISNEGELLIASDARSQKNHQLKQNPSATAVFWFSELRKQFRISGMVRIVSATDNHPIRLQLWNELSDAARALFYWPPCGEIRGDNDEFVKTISAESPAPEGFELLLLSPQSVETLDLNPHPHLRVRWVQNGSSWKEQALNP